jgi:isocitrate dehydrogenase
MADQLDIIYTQVDEAPELASGSFLPIIQTFLAPAGISVGTKDISLAGRIVANMTPFMPAEHGQPDDLALLGKMVTEPEANIIKLPNISASIPQLNAAIKELQEKGVPVPDFPENPSTDQEKKIRAAYGNVLGSAVNPVLRQGNSDRRAPNAVKSYARSHPHSMGEWVKDSKTHVATMGVNDFRSNEKSVTVPAGSEGDAKIEFVAKDGSVTELKAATPLDAGDVVDSTFMDCKALRKFLGEQVEDAKKSGVLFSVHLKATMMKVADPIIFGHAVSVYLANVFEKHGDTLANAGVNPNNGIGELMEKVGELPADKKAEIEADIQACMDSQPDLYMVNSDRGLTNLHVPSDVIIDASMPALIRGGGKGWDKDNKPRDTKCVIPDSSYAAVYDETIKFCIENGAYDPTKMGTVANVGLMARQAEEYGSHPQTFTAPADGLIRVVDAAGNTLLEHNVAEGDIWRACITRDPAIKDWVQLGVRRARLSGDPAIFWLNKDRAHDAQLIEKVHEYLKDLDTDGLDIQIMSPQDATRHALERVANGQNTISVTGNVLRDYLTDLFPILEVGTSAKMLSIVPLMAGGGLFETGAGGSAPKHVQQMLEEGHLRWDSLGEFCALGASLEHLSQSRGNAKAQVMADTLDRAITIHLETNKSPSRKVGELDNRGSHYYLAMFWAQALAEQDTDAELKAHFEPVAKALTENEDKIVAELNDAQGHSVDVGGYYRTDAAKVATAMRPSATLNGIMG